VLIIRLEFRFAKLIKQSATEGRASWDRILVGARFFAPVQTGPGAHPASCTMGLSRGCGVVHPSRSSTDIKERVELYVYNILRVGRGEGCATFPLCIKSRRTK